MCFIRAVSITRVKHYSFLIMMLQNKRNFKFALRENNIIIHYYQTFT